MARVPNWGASRSIISRDPTVRCSAALRRELEISSSRASIRLSSVVSMGAYRSILLFHRLRTHLIDVRIDVSLGAEVVLLRAVGIAASRLLLGGWRQQATRSQPGPKPGSCPVKACLIAELLQTHTDIAAIH